MVSSDARGYKFRLENDRQRTRRTKLIALTGLAYDGSCLLMTYGFIDEKFPGANGQIRPS